MSGPARGPARWWRLGVFTVATLLAVVVGVRNLESNGRGVVIVAGAVLIIAFLRLIVLDGADRQRGPFTHVLHAPLAPGDTATQVRDTERTVQLATATVGDAHRLLRPVVSDLVDEWLRATHGIDLRHPDAARLVPNELWDMARPDRPRPENPHAPGPATVEVAGIIEQLERLP